MVLTCTLMHFQSSTRSMVNLEDENKTFSVAVGMSDFFHKSLMIFCSAVYFEWLWPNSITSPCYKRACKSCFLSVLAKIILTAPSRILYPYTSSLLWWFLSWILTCFSTHSFSAKPLIIQCFHACGCLFLLFRLLWWILKGSVLMTFQEKLS